MAVFLSGGGGPSPTEGDVADAAVAAGAAGTISAKLRSISRDLITNIVLAAGENLIGKVAGSSVTVAPTITVNTAVYVIGDSIGGKISLPNAVRVSGGASILYSLLLRDVSNQKPTGTLLFFDSDPSAATTTDHAAFLFSTDIAKLVGVVPVASGDWVTINSMGLCPLSNLGRKMKSVATGLWVVFVAAGTPDFVASTDLSAKFEFIPVD